MISTDDDEPGARREQGPQALVALSQLALDHMEQGVCVYDADNRIVHQGSDPALPREVAS